MKYKSFCTVDQATMQKTLPVVRRVSRVVRTVARKSSIGGLNIKFYKNSTDMFHILIWGDKPSKAPWRRHCV